MWRTSSFSANNGACVECGQEDGTIAVRDTRLRFSPKLHFTPAAWNSFLSGVKADVPLISS